MASLIPIGVSLGAKLLGGLFGGSAKKKQQEAQNKAAIGQAELKNQMAEDKRLGNLGAGQSLLGQLTGRGFTNISPEAAASLGKRRSYDFSKAVPAAGAGLGSEFLSGLFGTVGDVASQYGINAGAPKNSAAAPAPSISGGAPVGGLDTSFEGALGTGSGTGVGPNGVSLDELKNLYKLGDTSSLH